MGGQKVKRWEGKGEINEMERKEKERKGKEGKERKGVEGRWIGQVGR